jgi:quercetin dioxygenase-like cupin family protein
MSRQGKIWGETTEIFKTENVTAHYLKIKAGGYCSEHRHTKKTNLFFVISGELQITIWKDPKIMDTTILEPGQISEIPAGVYHKFNALSDCECIEIYQAKLQGPDIDRRTRGGLRA